MLLCVLVIEFIRLYDRMYGICTWCVFEVPIIIIDVAGSKMPILEHQKYVFSIQLLAPM